LSSLCRHQPPGTTLGDTLFALRPMAEFADDLCCCGGRQRFMPEWSDVVHYAKPVSFRVPRALWAVEGHAYCDWPRRRVEGESMTFHLRGPVTWHCGCERCGSDAERPRRFTDRAVILPMEPPHG